jgi:alkanesulfonate monooxygenase SsuD/methylene tetrahydromethanopterin reductase-like flavin-dependent oxidoreductase (luciferase family)
MDHITNGRFILGIGNGYREVELEAAGTNRRERAPRVEESIEIMTRLWAGEELHHKGRFWNVNGRMALTPVQKPRPPIWIAVHAEGAARRAARLGDGALMAPQIYWDDLKRLCDAYEDECAKVGRRGTLGITPRIIVIRSPKERRAALAKMKVDAIHSIDRYRNWDMQESGMVNIRLERADNDPTNYAFIGSPEEIIEKISRYKEELHVDYMGGMMANAPKSVDGKIEAMQYMSEKILRKIK